MKNYSIKKIVTTGVLGAVTVVMAITPLGLLPWFGGASLTIMHIPVLIAAILEGPISGTIVGLIFGVTSMLRAAIAPNGPLDLLFVNPLVSILPRLLIGVSCWLVFKLFKGKVLVLSSAVSAAVGSLVNTVFVLFMLVLTASTELAGEYGVAVSAIPKIIGGVALANGPIEAAAAAILTSAVISAWTGVTTIHSGSKLSKENKE